MSVIDGAERALDGLGLMTGDMAIPKRFLFGALLGAFLVTYIKPSIMFEGGKPKPWSMMVGADNAADATPVPWFMVPIATGVMLSTFI
jgi:hypothetical protein